MEKEYLEINRKLWNDRLESHVKSEFYDVPSFLGGRSSLNAIELELLGDVKGKSILHLQCHFGQDSLSLSRLGAKVTGVDFSDKAIEYARQTAQELELNAEFICSDIYSLPEHLDGEFDIVFTSYGTIGWLPDLNEWASIVSRYLKLGGQFIFVEFHPVLWMFDDDFKEIKYRYFRSAAIVENNEASYTDHSETSKGTSIGWNQSIGEVCQALISNGLKLESLNEYDYSPYDCFNETVEKEEGRYCIKGMEDKLPMVYSITALKPEK